MKRRFTSKHFIVIVLALTASILYFIFYVAPEGRPKTDQSTSKVTRGELIQRSTISGIVTPLRKTIITAPYQGYVRKVFVELGQKVKSGDPIASVAPTLVAADTVFPLRSPFAGRVVQLNKAEGEFVKASDATDFIARIDDMSKMFVDCNVPELDRVKMRVGLSAVVKATAILDRTYSAEVKELTLAAREEDRYGRSTAVEFPMRLELTDFDERIRPGMSVIVDIITYKSDNALRLRHEFIGRQKDTYFVTLANGKRQSVKLGVQNEEYSEILSGVEEGVTVRKVDFSEFDNN